MAKTSFTNGSYVTPTFLNTLYVTGGGHVHDGGSTDGHSQKVRLDSGTDVVGELPSDMVDNGSHVAGGSVTDALNQLYDIEGDLYGRFDSLAASNVQNDSTVAGATVRDALNGLSGQAVGTHGTFTMVQDRTGWTAPYDWPMTVKWSRVFDVVTLQFMTAYTASSNSAVLELRTFGDGTDNLSVVIHNTFPETIRPTTDTMVPIVVLDNNVYKTALLRIDATAHNPWFCYLTNGTLQSAGYSYPQPDSGNGGFTPGGGGHNKSFVPQTITYSLY